MNSAQLNAAVSRIYLNETVSDEAHVQVVIVRAPDDNTTYDVVAVTADTENDRIVVEVEEA